MRYSFGRSSLDTSSRELTLDGAAMHLSPKAFELLRLLIESRPRVVPKAELMRRLWPDTFVEEANLPVLIGEVRAAIGDSVQAHTIKTHHRVGYAFAAEVRITSSAPVGGQAHSHALVLLLQGRRITLSPGVHLVGRARDADVRVDDPCVSRRHARIVVDGDIASIEDLGSRNGTQVGGVPVCRPTRLTAGDVVALGGLEARIVQPDDDTATSLL